MYDRILVPVDGSDPSRRAAAYGIGIASTCGADVELVHVVETGGILRSLLGDDGRKRRRSRGREVLADAAELADGTGVDVETRILEGDVAESVLRAAGDRGADLVVVGKHGRGGVREAILGSVPTEVLRHGDVPTLVVPGGEVEVDPAVGSVLAPTDGSECAGRAIDHAGGFAAAFGSDLHLLTVVDVATAGGPFDAGGVSEEFVERLTAEAERTVGAAAERIGDREVRTAVVRGSPHDGILSYADEEGIDLVVMGSRGRSEVERRLLGSVTEGVVRVGAVPVLVVH